MVKMKRQDLSEKEKREICDAIGKFLIGVIYTNETKAHIKSEIANIAKKKGLSIDPTNLLNAMEFHVQVHLKE
jgi:uncharacterized protein YqeY